MNRINSIINLSKFYYKNILNIRTIYSLNHSIETIKENKILNYSMSNKISDKLFINSNSVQFIQTRNKKNKSKDKDVN